MLTKWVPLAPHEYHLITTTRRGVIGIRILIGVGVKITIGIGIEIGIWIGINIRMGMRMDIKINPDRDWN